MRFLALACLAVSLSAAQPAPLTGSVGFGPNTPRYVSTVFEFHDPKGELWPAYFHGRVTEPVNIVISDTEIKGSLAMAAEGESLMRQGNQHRLIGELFKDVGVTKVGPDGKTVYANEMPFPKVTIKQLTPQAGKDKKGASLTFKGSLELAGKTVPLSGTGSLGKSGNDGDEVITISVTATFLGKDLGLTKYADREVRLDLYTAGKQGVDATAAPAPKGKKK